MGYTHYWSFTVPKKGYKDLEVKYQKAIIAIGKALQTYQKTVDDDSRLSGYSAHTKPGSYGGIKFNGKQENGHEDFYLREHLNQNDAGNFCKTAMKPYDTAVTASLILLNHYLTGIVDVGSDGDAADWLEGLRLAKTVCPSAKIPASIRGTTLKALRA